MNHLNNDELNEFIDGRLNNSERERVLGHLQECPSCASANRLLVMIDRSIRNQPVKKTGAQFVEKLMNRLDPHAERSQYSRLEQILKYAANLFAIMLVLAMIYGIYSVVNIFMPAEQTMITQMEGSSTLSAIRSEVSSWWNSAFNQMHIYIDMLVPEGVMPVWMNAACAILAIIIVDRVVGKRFRHLNSLR